jgi:hypothetical protein
MTTTSRLHPALAWGLAGSVLASAWALWWPKAGNEGEAGRVVSRAALSMPSAPSASASVAPVAATRPNADASVEDPRLLSPASRDPFNPAPPPMPADVGQATAQAAKNEPAPPPAPPAPVAPAMNHSIVEAVTPREVRLRHPLAAQAVALPVPDDNAP